MTDAGFIVWRGIRLESHGRWMWLSKDRLWKVTTYEGGPYVSHLQFDITTTFVSSGPTPHEALDNLALVAADFAVRLTDAMRQIQ